MIQLESTPGTESHGIQLVSSYASHSMGDVNNLLDSGLELTGVLIC